MPAMKFDAIEPNLKRARNTNGSVSEREGDEDRLSDLPDCVLIHLLEFLTTKDAVMTTLLSTRWKDLWKRVPSLRLRRTDPEFRHMTLFKKFVNKVLSFRDGSVPLHSLDFCYDGLIPPKLLIRVVKYAESHRIEQLRLNIDSGGIELPPCLFSIQTITWLDLSVPNGEALGLLPKFLNMTALMSLRLRRFAFSAGDGEVVDPFSGCIKLKTLVIEHYVVKKISSKSNLPFLEEVNIDVPKSVLSSRLHSPFILISWLQLLANILSKIPDLVNTESPCLDNLKSLIVKVQKFRRPEKLHKAELQLSSPRIDGAVDFLIRNSLFPEVTIVDY
ncbi:hypothetical protein AAHE18_17G231000 [Arachis hypogaea]